MEESLRTESHNILCNTQNKHTSNIMSWSFYLLTYCWQNKQDTTLMWLCQKLQICNITFIAKAEKYHQEMWQAKIKW